jgi:hypothetical protein
LITFIIPLLLGTILGFLIRGKPSDTFAITKGRRAAWGIGIALSGVAIGAPIGLSISSTTGPQIAGLIGTGLGLGVFNVLSIENLTYKKWSDRRIVLGVSVVLSLLIVYVILVLAGVRAILFSTASTPGKSTRDVFQKSIESRVPQEYLGVMLADSAEEVRYKLGEPSSISQEFGLFYYYEFPDHAVGISFTDESRQVNAITCGKKLFSEGGSCPRLLGIGLNDDEEKVRSILGDGVTEYFQEGRDNRANRALLKYMKLERNNKIQIILEKQKVKSISLLASSN